MEQNFLFNLSKTLRYTPKGEGDFSETGTIEFFPPSMDVFNESTRFEQIIMKSMMSASKMAGAEKKDDQEVSLSNMKAPTPDEMRIVIFAGDVDVSEIANRFKSLACKTGKLDEKTYLKNSHFNKLSKADFIDMMCGYASFFVFPSLLRGEEQKGNGSQ